MKKLVEDDPIVISLVDSITKGTLGTLVDLLKQHEGLANVSVVAADKSWECRPLHYATDWPGHFPNIPETIRILIEAGAEVDTRGDDPNGETPLHLAASSNDVGALDALIDGGASMAALGASTDGGTALSNAINFGNWEAAQRLVERGSPATIGEAAALGMLERVQRCFEEGKACRDGIQYAFWMACSRGHLDVVRLLLDKGAEINNGQDWGHGAETALSAAEKGKYQEVIKWLKEHGAR